MEFDQELLPLEAQLPNLPPGKGGDALQLLVLLEAQEGVK
jgi:hypothetical protein